MSDVRLAGGHLRVSAAVIAPLLDGGNTQVVIAPREDGTLCIAPGAGKHVLRFNPRMVFTIAKQRSLAGDRVIALYELLEGEALGPMPSDACTWEWSPDLRTLTVHHPALADALCRAAQHSTSSRREHVAC